MAAPKVLFLLADYGHDPTEVSIPFTAFTKSGFEIHFATESGRTPECDSLMLTGLTQKLLGAAKPTIALYAAMTTSPAFTNPLSWAAPGFSLAPYNLVFLPGGHDKGVRQLLDSTAVHSVLSAYFPSTLKPSNHAIGAVCHGVLALANSSFAEDSTAICAHGNSLAGKSLVYELKSTALPKGFENLAYWGTKLWLGDYYKTYGAGSVDVEEEVKAKMKWPEKQWQGSLGVGAFVVEDGRWNYVSARFPGDVEKMAERLVELVKENMQYEEKR